MVISDEALNNIIESCRSKKKTANIVMYKWAIINYLKSNTAASDGMIGKFLNIKSQSIGYYTGSYKRSIKIDNQPYYLELQNALNKTNLINIFIKFTSENI